MSSHRSDRPSKGVLLSLTLLVGCRAAPFVRPSPPPVLPIVKVGLEPGFVNVTFGMDLDDVDGHFGLMSSREGAQISDIRVFRNGVYLDRLEIGSLIDELNNRIQELEPCDPLDAMPGRHPDWSPSWRQVQFQFAMDQITGDEAHLRLESTVWFYRTSRPQGWEVIEGAFEYVHQ